MSDEKIPSIQKTSVTGIRAGRDVIVGGNVFFFQDETGSNPQSQHQELVNSLISIAKQCYREEMDKHTATVLPVDTALLFNHHTLSVAVANRRVSGTMQLQQNIMHQISSVLQDLYTNIQLINIKKRRAGAAIGIDFGTTLCCVAVCKEPHKPEIIPNDNDNNKTPSYVAFLDISNSKKDPEVACGETAKQQASSNPKGTIFDVKRMLGQKVSSSLIQQCIRFWPFDVVSDHDQILVKPGRTTKQTFTPVQITAYLLRHLVTLAEEFLESPVVNAVIAVPVEFSAYQEMLIRDACELAHLNLLKIVHEPTAASIAYHNVRDEKVSEHSTYCVIIDFGGGTFDVAVLKIHDHRVHILEIGGSNCLGGNLIDANMAEYCIAKFKEHRGVDLKKQQNAQDLATAETVSKYLRQLIVKCEDHKKFLSLRNKTLIYMDEILGAHSLSISMTKEKFHSINAEIFETGISIISKVLKDCHINKLAVDEVVLVGGSSRIPVFRNMIKDFFQKEPLLKSVRVDEAVAAGAAILASEAFDMSVRSVLVPKLKSSTTSDLTNIIQNAMIELTAEDTEMVSNLSTKLDPQQIQTKHSLFESPAQPLTATAHKYGWTTVGKAIDGGLSRKPAIRKTTKDVFQKETLLQSVRVEGAMATEAAILASEAFDLSVLSVRDSKLICWKNKINGFPPGREHAVVAVGNEIYSFGGADSSFNPSYSLDVLDVLVFYVNEREKQLKKLSIGNSGVNPNQRRGHSAVTYKQFVLIFGGWDKNKRKSSNSTYRLNTETLKWDKPNVTGNVPDARCYHSAVVLRNEMFVYGGEGNEVTNDLHSLHLESFCWSTITTKGIPPSLRERHSATVHDDRLILIFGGWDCNENKTLNTIWSFDLNNKTWTAVETCGTPPSSREHHCAFVHNGRMYIFGGRDEQDTFSNDVFSFDAETFEWKEVTPKGEAPSPRSQAGCVALKDQVFIFGGWNGNIYLDSTHVLQM